MNRGDFAQEWATRPLIEVATLQRGYDLPIQDRTEGQFPIFAANGPVGFHGIAKCQGPGVVTGRSGTIGKVHFVEGDYWPLNTSLYVTNFHGNEPRWVYYLLQSFGLERFSQGAGVPTLNRNLIHGEPIKVPPLSEQRRIAAILDQADALRAKRREALAQLDRLTQSIFIEMFGDPVSNPKNWPTTSVSEFLKEAEVFVDGDWVESKDQDPDGEVRLIQLADVGDGIYINKSARFLNKQTSMRLKCTPLKQGDVLIARMPYPLGRACIFPGDAKECVTVVDVCIIRPSSNGPEPIWLMCCINTQSFRNRIAGEATGTTRTRISRGNLSKLCIISPPHSLQKQFVERHQSVFQLRQNALAALEELDILFASLQHRAFRGEL